MHLLTFKIFMKYLLQILLICFVTFSLNAQPGTYPESLKQSASCESGSVYMMNESMHGLLIVQRIFENDNQTLNKYADHESQQINFYGNEDLPKNVFEDPDHWFYAITPYEWFAAIEGRCSSVNSGMPTGTISKLEDAKTTLDQINQMRFTIDNELRNRDLNKLDDITAVYKMMETAATQCDHLLDIRNQLETILRSKVSKLNADQEFLIKLLEPLYKASEQLMLAVRADNEAKVKAQLTALNVAYKEFQAKKAAIKFSSKNDIIPNFSEPFLQNIDSKVAELIKEAKEYLGDSPFDAKYAAYGRNYYYYNVRLLSLFNKYGKGMVFEMNQLLLQANIPYSGFLELPHYVKIIYPEKRPELERSLVTTETVEVLPEQLRNRRVVQRQQSITADGLECVLEISDNQEEDGDIVSINFNGKWIIENYHLRKEPIKLPIMLNKQGKNYLLLHAENMGTVPPNTIAIRYKLNGKTKKIILNSSDKESEMIQIKPNIIAQKEEEKSK